MIDLKEMLDGLRVKPYVTGYKPRTSNYPSAASVQFEKNGRTITEGNCMRQDWYEFKNFNQGKKGARSARISRILDAGKMYEDMFVTEFKNAGIWVGDEIPFYIEDCKLSGRIDALIKDPTKAPAPPGRPSPDQLIGVEIKTCAGFFGTKGPIKAGKMGGKDIPLAPKIDNVLQCLCYLEYYSKFGINKWLLIYIDRGLGDSEKYPAHWNYHIIEVDKDRHPVVTNEHGTTVWSHFTVDDVLNRFRKLIKHVDDNTLPPRDYAAQYSNKLISEMFLNGEFAKTDTDNLNRYLRVQGKTLKDVTEEDPPMLTKGDWRCRFCDFDEICYSDKPSEIPKPIQKAKKLVAPKLTEEPKEVEDLV